MGRYYSGDINGKFWFGVQSSYDADNFCENPLDVRKNRYNFKVCNCPNYDNDSYCMECYDSFEAHCQDAGSQDLMNNEIVEIDYSFVDEEHLQLIKNKLNEIANELGQDVIENLQFDITDTDGYCYEIDDGFVDEISTSRKELLARYCLGRQIEASLIDNGCCCFSCEL